MAVIIVRMAVAGFLSELVATFPLMENMHLDQVEAQTTDSCDDHFKALDFWSFDDSINGLEDKPNSQSQQEDYTAKGS